MEFVMTFLIFLFAIVLTNVLSSVYPKLPLPLLQIGCGILLALAPFCQTLQLDPELFLLLVIAPLLFREAEEADILTLWKAKKPIFNMAFVLVFVTVLAIGFFTHWLLPAIPLAACFALGAILGPTDAVAVFSLAKKIPISDDVLTILEGEVLINDASGITALQFAVIALLTGTFSPTNALFQLLTMCLGGFLIGYLLAHLKRKGTMFLRKTSVDNLAIFMLIEVLTPFIGYYLAEHFGVSGIFAVITAGSMSALDLKKLNLFESELHTTKDTVWTMLSTLLNSFVFLLLGMQLPPIISQIWSTSMFPKGLLTLAIILITAALFLVRFLCIPYFTRHQKKANTAEQRKDRLILTLSGAKGTVSLATAFSLPLLLNDGTLFQARPYLLCITGGVIILSLCTAYICLPLVTQPAKQGRDKKGQQLQTQMTILQEVILQLQQKAADHPNQQLNVVIFNYQKRLGELFDNSLSKAERKELKHLRDRMLQLETTSLTRQFQNQMIHWQTYLFYTRILHMTRQLKRNGLRTKSKFILAALRSTTGHPSGQPQHVHRPPSETAQQEMVAAFQENTTLVVKALQDLHGIHTDRLLHYLSSERLFIAEQLSKGDYMNVLKAQLDQSYKETLLAGYAYERQIISQFLSAGTISTEQANQLRKNVNSLESFVISDAYNPLPSRFRTLKQEN